jgi:transcriptional regulator with XRE-family HTH domain
MPATRNKSRKLTPLQLHRKVQLMQRGISQADIARQVGMGRAAVSLVMLDEMRNEAIEQAIADAVGEDRNLLFPPKVKAAA